MIIHKVPEGCCGIQESLHSSQDDNNQVTFISHLRDGVCVCVCGCKEWGVWQQDWGRIHVSVSRLPKNYATYRYTLCRVIGKKCYCIYIKSLYLKLLLH